MSRNPAVILYDAIGNPVGLSVDGAFYRLQTQSTLVGKVGGVGVNREVTVVDDVTLPAIKRLQVEAALAPGTALYPGAVPTESRSGFLTLNGAGVSADMVVDGSVVNQSFRFGADALQDIYLSLLRVVFVAKVVKLDGASFGKGNALAVGIQVSATVNGGSVVSLGNIQHNEEWVHWSGETHTEYGGKEQVISVSLGFSQRERLVAGSGDHVEVLIRDDLTVGALKVTWLRASLSGFIEVP